MNIKRINSEWWILNVPNTAGQPESECGPYDSKAEAKIVMESLETFVAGNPKLFAERRRIEAAKGSAELILERMIDDK